MCSFNLATVCPASFCASDVKSTASMISQSSHSATCSAGSCLSSLISMMIIPNRAKSVTNCEQTSRVIKSLLCNMQVGQHVEWWENLLPDATTHTAASSWFSHHMLTYLHIAQPAFDQFRHLFTILELWQTARKITGGGATHNSKFILYHIIYL